MTNVDVDIFVFDDTDLRKEVVEKLSYVRGSSSNPPVEIENEITKYHFAWGYPWNAIGGFGDSIGIEVSNRQTVHTTSAYKKAIEFLRSYDKKAILFFDFQLNSIEFEDFDLTSISEWHACKQIAGIENDHDAIVWFNDGRQGLVLAVVACSNRFGDFDVYLHSYNKDGGSVESMPDKLKLVGPSKHVSRATDSLFGSKPENAAKAVTNAAKQFVELRTLPDSLTILLEY